MDHSDYDEGLWDELNHQQSREIEQHQNLRDQAYRGNPWLPPAIGNAIRQTARAVVLGLAGNAENAQRNDRYESLASLMPPSSQDIDNDLGMNVFGSGQTKHQRDEPLLSGSNLYRSRFQEHQPPPDPPSNENNNNNSQNNGAYVFLQPFRLLPQRDGWGAVADLDVFFNSLYQYYYHRGFTTLAMKGIVEIITLFFTLGLSVFLFAYLDWSALANCTEEDTCRATFSDYIIDSPMSQPSSSFAWKCWFFLYSLIFAVYGLFSAWSWWHALLQARASKWFMEEQLGIGERKLQSGAVDWDRDVVCKIQQLQVSGQYRIAIHGQADETLDALLVAQRILRKENFMVALFNNPTLLDFSLPVLPGVVFFSKSLEWTIYFCILNFMFNHKYQLRPAFYLDPNSLKRRFFLCGIGHVIFMPFLLFFMTLYFSLQNAYDWKSTKNYLGPREWALAAKWTLREFNELPHLFEQRMEPSYDAAEKYLKLFRQNEIITAIGRILVFLGGSLGAVLFAFAAMNDAILLHVKIADWNLLWYAGVVAATYSTGKAMLPSEEKKNPTRTYHTNLSQEMDLALEEVAKHTHHYPDVWKGRGWDKTTTYKAFKKMYQYKAKLFAMELVSIVVAPVILCVSLPRCAERICDFILAIRAEVAGAGDMCGCSTFDFDKFGDELWEGKTLGRSVENLQQAVAAAQQRTPPPVITGSLSESIMQSGNVMESTQQFPIPRAKEGKMEKSFFSFKAAHPNWKCNRSGQELVDKLEEYQKEESAALARERQLHIEAAARQLETLAQIEQQQQRSRHGGVVVDTNAMNDRYIPTSTQTAADAGAGLQSSPLVQRLPPIVEHNAMNGMQAPARTLGQTSTSTNEVNREYREEHASLPFAAHPRPQTGMASSVNRHATVDSSSPSNLVPPPSIFPPQPPGSQSTTQFPTSASVVAPNRAAAGLAPSESLALSSELRRILNLSTLDPDVGSVLGESASLAPLANAVNLARSISGLATVEEERNRARERQYLLLERYHAHNMVASRQHQREDQQQPHPAEAAPVMQQPEHAAPFAQHPQHQSQNPMSISLAEGGLRLNSGRSQSNGIPESRSGRLGGSSVL